MQIDPNAAIDAAKPFAPAILGALLGLMHNRERPWQERIVAFATGVLVAHYGGEAVVAYFKMGIGPIADGAKFALGLFGMSIVHAIYDQIGPFWTQVRERVVNMIGSAPAKPEAPNEGGTK